MAAQKLSYDYDGVLTTSKCKENIIEAVKNGYDVYIISARSDIKTILPLVNEVAESLTHV